MSPRFGASGYLLARTALGPGALSATYAIRPPSRGATAIPRPPYPAHNSRIFRRTPYVKDVLTVNASSFRWPLRGPTCETRTRKFVKGLHAGEPLLGSSLTSLATYVLTYISRWLILIPERRNPVTPVTSQRRPKGDGDRAAAKEQCRPEGGQREDGKRLCGRRPPLREDSLRLGVMPPGRVGSARRSQIGEVRQAVLYASTDAMQNRSPDHGGLPTGRALGAGGARPVAANTDTPASGRHPGAELRRLREASGLTTTQAADRMLVSQSKISHLENGHRAANPRDVRELCAIYGVTDQEVVDSLMRAAAETWGRSVRHRWQAHFNR
ncbi:helix-turn-helix domain-containing protein [Streptomyces antarcticus]|uniref:helix-turn-helix domain-containing protein n=1 Tax=Streptomyces antarcticus TaxID=2996458 RepID=UPI002D1E3CD4|nr:helix-turn-helix transcriptional regulator [Streptomyces sp. H34-AA3]